MRRVVSLWLPRFATERLSHDSRRRARGTCAGTARAPISSGSPASPRAGPCRPGTYPPGAPDETVRPHVLTARLRGQEVLAAVDARAEASGLSPGLTLADARALRPDLAAAVHDPDADAAALHERGILYAPDFIINAGGALAFGLRSRGVTDEAVLQDRLAGIGDILDRVFASAAQAGETPLAAAEQHSRRVIEAARRS